jgi:hypothetical protein
LAIVRLQLKGKLMSAENLPRKPGEDWIAIVRKNSTQEFAAAFASNPVPDTSVMNGPCIGVDAIASFFAATADGMYDSLAFTNETIDGPKTYLEWEGKAFGKDVGGYDDPDPRQSGPDPKHPLVPPAPPNRRPVLG